MSPVNHLLRPPAEFVVNPDQNRYAAWKQWAKKFIYYATATSLQEKAPITQQATLLAVMGDFGNREFERAVQATLADTDGFRTILDRLSDHFKQELNVTQSRFEFFHMKQGGKPIENFAQELERESEECDFCPNCTDSIIASCLIVGLDDADTKQHVLHNGGRIDKRKAVQLARNFANSELIEEKIRTVNPHASTSSAPPTAQVDAIRPKPQTRARDSGQSGHQKVKCTKGCRSHPDQQCRAASVTCFKCKRLGHFSSVCPKVHSLALSMNDETQDSGASEVTCDSLRLFDLEASPQNRSQTPQTPTQWWQVLQVGSTQLQVKFKLDCGAEISVLPWRFFVRCAQPSALKQTSRVVLSYSAHPLKIAGICTLRVGIPGLNGAKTINFFIIHTDLPPILGLPECVELGLVKRTNPAFNIHSIEEERSSLLQEHADLFGFFFENSAHSQACNQSRSTKPTHHLRRLFPPGVFLFDIRSTS